MKNKKESEITNLVEKPVMLNMTYEQAMKKALNTPLPKKDKQKKKAK